MPTSRPKISAVIITLNEEAQIADCLKTVAWCDEVVIVDSQSQDRTVEIARAMNARVFVEPWRGLGHQKNRAVELATGDWIFSLDADERCTPELAAEIQQVVQGGQERAYRVRRKNLYRGRWIKHGGWWPDYIVRLFPKKNARFNEARIHAALDTGVAGVGTLNGVILHYSYADVPDFIDRMEYYAIQTAVEKYEKGGRGSWFKAIVHAAAAFFKLYIFRSGWLDGGPGLLIAFSQASCVFYRYAHLTELGESRRMIVGAPEKPHEP